MSISWIKWLLFCTLLSSADFFPRHYVKPRKNQQTAGSNYMRLWQQHQWRLRMNERTEVGHLRYKGVSSWKLSPVNTSVSDFLLGNRWPSAMTFSPQFSQFSPRILSPKLIKIGRDLRPSSGGFLSPTLISLDDRDGLLNVAELLQFSPELFAIVKRLVAEIKRSLVINVQNYKVKRSPVWVQYTEKKPITANYTQLLNNFHSVWQRNITLRSDWKTWYQRNSNYSDKEWDELIKLKASVDSFERIFRDCDFNAYNCPVVSNPLILDPKRGSSPTILNPFIFSPYILSPYIFGPFILSPLLLTPQVLSPSIFSPVILSPLLLSPIILSPQAIEPTILSPNVLSPLILSPVLLSPTILSPTVLSPCILSPSALSPVVASPCALCPAILCPGILSDSTLSPCTLC